MSEQRTIDRRGTHKCYECLARSSCKTNDYIAIF